MLRNLRRLIVALGCTALIAGAVALPIAAKGADSTTNAAETQYGGGGEGCTPGYWKNHTDEAVWGTTYSLESYFDEIFGVGPHITLLEALETGGGGFKALGRHAVAALLNADSSSIGYSLEVDGVIAQVKAAYASGQPEPIKDEFAASNEETCPINAKGEVTGGS